MGGYDQSMRFISLRMIQETTTYTRPHGMFDLILDNSHRYLLENCIGTLGAIVLNTGVLDFEQVSAVNFWDSFRNCSEMAAGDMCGGTAARARTSGS